MVHAQQDRPDFTLEPNTGAHVLNATVVAEQAPDRKFEVEEDNPALDRQSANRPVSHFVMYALAVTIGAFAGLGAVFFRGLIAFFHNLLFLGQFSIVYDANSHTPPSPWGALVILVPVIGAIGVAWLVQNFAPEAKGHGVPEVMDAIYYKRGVVRPVVALIKSFASALSIGSGGSVGREGPIIQIGSSLGSTLGQLIAMSVKQRITLIAAGAGAGIAATFNTPVGGVLFAIELMLPEISVETLVPVAIATATATYIGRVFLGNSPSFFIPSLQVHFFHITYPLVLLAYVVLGVLMGLISALYIRSIYAFEDFFESHIKRSYYVRHILGMLIVGVMIYLCMRYFGHYYIEGVGYATVQDVLTQQLTDIRLLLILFILKLLAVSITLGSGASGGVFSPGLFMGAMVGGAYGILLQQTFPQLSISPPAFALAGMAAIIGGSTGAALASIVMIFEMTLDYNVIIPLSITVALSYGIRKLIMHESIYTTKLVRRGHYLPTALRADIHENRRIKDIMDAKLEWLPASATINEVLEDIAEKPSVREFMVEEDGHFIGFIQTRRAIRAWETSGDRTLLKDVASQEYIAIQEDCDLFDMFVRVRDEGVNVVIVLKKQALRPHAGLLMHKAVPIRKQDIIGIITYRNIASLIVGESDFFRN